GVCIPSYARQAKLSQHATTPPAGRTLGAGDRGSRTAERPRASMNALRSARARISWLAVAVSSTHAGRLGWVRSEESGVGGVTGVQTCALPISGVCIPSYARQAKLSQHATTPPAGRTLGAGDRGSRTAERPRASMNALRSARARISWLAFAVSSTHAGRLGWL